MVAESEIIHVAVAPPPLLDEELVRKVADVIGKNSYETRLRLTGKIPKIIANYDTRQQTELAAQNLRRLGLVVILFTDSELRQPWPIQKMRSLKLDEGAVTFYDRLGQAKRLEANQVFLILHARLAAYVEKESVKIVRKINLTATILTGGIPVTKKVKQKTISRESQIESFVRIYSREPGEPVLEIRQQNFDYSFLGPEMISSAAGNFIVSVKKIREALPQAIFDNRLTEPFGADSPAVMEQDSIEAMCKMLYWYYEAAANASTLP